MIDSYIKQNESTRLNILELVRSHLACKAYTTDLSLDISSPTYCEVYSEIHRTYNKLRHEINKTYNELQLDIINLCYNSSLINSSIESIAKSAKELPNAGINVPTFMFSNPDIENIDSHLQELVKSHDEMNEANKKQITDSFSKIGIDKEHLQDIFTLL